MAYIGWMGETRLHLRCSSSISNFREKLERRLDLPRWRYHFFQPTLFVGLYHIGDYAAFILHRSKRTVFWCGSDILNLKRSLFRFIIPRLQARHICENQVEQEALAKMGIQAEVHPMIFDPDLPPEPAYNASNPVHVYMTVHKGREAEYGLHTVIKIYPKVPNVTFHIYGTTTQLSCGNVTFHGKVSNEQFNEEIRHYHAALRLNEFDGMSETVAKSVLLGQYPITKIRYPMIDWAPDDAKLIEHLRNLSTKTEPNHLAAATWATIFNKSKQELLRI